MRYNFIEVGTSDFHTLIQQADDETVGLSIEPLIKYLNSLPNKKNVKKIAAALSETDSTIEIYHVPSDVIYGKSLPVWLRGCNSVNKPHEYARQKLGPEIYDSLVVKDLVPTISWKTLIKENNITSIDFLKIDTEGHEVPILSTYFTECESNPNLYAKKIMFEYNESSDKEGLDSIVNSLKIYDVEIQENDVILTMKKNIGFHYKNYKLSDVAYVINLPERKDRRNHIDNLLSSLGFWGYEFVDGMRVEGEGLEKMGCTQTYLSIFENFLNTDNKDIIVIEDDAKLMSKVTDENLKEIFSEWDETKKQYDVIALGVKLLPRSKITQKGKTHGEFEEMLCSQGLYYKRNFIVHYFEQMKNFLNPDHFLYKCTIDMFLNDSSCEEFRFRHHHSHKKFNFGITIPMVFTHTDTLQSSIGNSKSSLNDDSFENVFSKCHGVQNA